jgi:Protein of unknown function (DUF2442)
MNFSVSEENTPPPVAVDITDSDLVVQLADGRTIATPLVWYPLLLNATPDQRRNVVIGPVGIHWPDLDEDLSVAGMLAGVIPSYKWLDQQRRAAGAIS